LGFAKDPPGEGPQQVPNVTPGYCKGFFESKSGSKKKGGGAKIPGWGVEVGWGVGVHLVTNYVFRPGGPKRGGERGVKVLTMKKEKLWKVDPKKQRSQRPGGGKNVGIKRPSQGLVARNAPQVCGGLLGKKTVGPF